MDTYKRDFKWIWIPKEVWLSDELTLQEKVFFVEIDSLDNDEWCYANNDYFSKFFWISKVRVSEVISSLIKKGYIESNIKAEEGNKRILKTLLKKSLWGSQTKVYEGLKEKFKHNNTINNTINNTDISTNVDISKGLIVHEEKTELELLLQDFKRSRAKLRKPMTDKAMELLLRKLSDYSEAEQIAMLEEAIEKGWQSVYPPKMENRAWKNPTRSEMMAKINIT